MGLFLNIFAENRIGLLFYFVNKMLHKQISFRGSVQLNRKQVKRQETINPCLVIIILQAQILIPLACSIVFGLLATTLLVLLVVPALYSVFADFNLIRPSAAEMKDCS